MRTLTLWNDDFEPVKATAVYRNAVAVLAIFYGVCLASAALAGWGYSLSMSSSPRAQADGAFADGSRIGQSPAPAPAVSKSAGHVSRLAERRAVPAPTIAKTAVPVRKIQIASGAAAPHAAASTSQQTRYMVQVASVRNLRNAQVLTSQLRNMGFDAKIHRGRHDPYLHVQIGPFANIDQAQAMRRRVAARGYRAVLK